MFVQEYLLPLGSSGAINKINTSYLCEKSSLTTCNSQSYY